MMAAIVKNAVGCAAGPGSRMAEAEQALAAKYGEEFVVTEYRGQEASEEYYTVTAYAKEHPELLFEASVDTEGEGAGTAVSDTYISRRVCDRLRQAVSVNLGSLQGLYSVHAEELNPYALGNDPEISPAEYVREKPGANFLIYLNYVPDGTAPSEAAEILSGFSKGTGINRGKLAVFIMDEKTLADAAEYAETHAFLGDDYQSIADSSYLGTLTITDGEVSREELRQLLDGRF